MLHQNDSLTQFAMSSFVEYQYYDKFITNTVALFLMIFLIFSSFCVRGTSLSFLCYEGVTDGRKQYVVMKYVNIWKKVVFIIAQILDT